MDNNLLEKIYGSGLKLLEPITIEETYAAIVNEAKKLVQAEFGSIFLSINDELIRVYASSPELYMVTPRKHGFTYTVFKTKKPMVLSQKELTSIHPEFKKIGTRSDIMIPLINNKKALGVLTMMSLKDHHFDQNDLNVLKLLGPIASLAIRKVQLYDETRAALEMRDLFISMASHELRTPLTSISGYAQLLFSKLGMQDTAEARWTKQLAWECTRMTNILQELLTVNQLRSGDLHYSWKEVSIQEVLAQAINSFHFIFADREITLNYPDSNQLITIIGDFDKLVQAFSNLLENSGKFSPANSIIQINVQSLASAVKIVITDQGIGIKKEDLAKIFEKFYQGSGHTREGMGIGLFLVKDIIEHHRGNIKIISKAKKGTRVEISLPRANR